MPHPSPGRSSDSHAATGPAASTTTGRSAGRGAGAVDQVDQVLRRRGAAGRGEGAQPLLQQVGVLAPQDPAEAAGGRREAGRPIVGRTRR